MSRAKQEEPEFRLRPRETLPAAVERIAIGEIDAILARLRGHVTDEAVHEVRKATKRLRAIVRLVRDELGKRRYRREKRVFRGAARALSPSRDVAVLAATVDGLAERFGDDGHSRVLEPVRRAVHARVREARHSNGARRAPSRIAADLRRARARIGRWPVSDGDPWNVVQDGIDRIYRKARVAWKAAAAKPTVARLHEWRKRTKDLRYTLQLLEPIWPDVVEALADEVDDLADLLGEDHDLAMLERFVRDPSLACENDDRRAVLAMIDVSRRERQARAWTLAARVYESPPRRFLRRMATYWRAWCDDTAASSDDDAARLAS